MLTCFGVSVLKGSMDEQLSKETTGDCGCCFVSLSISFEIDSCIYAKGQSSESKGREPVALFIRLIIRTFQLDFLAGTVFFSHNKSAISVFQPAYQHSRTGPMLLY
jgi:hypothetical protein